MLQLWRSRRQGASTTTLRSQVRPARLGRRIHSPNNDQPKESFRHACHSWGFKEWMPTWETTKTPGHSRSMNAALFLVMRSRSQRSQDDFAIIDKLWGADYACVVNNDAICGHIQPVSSPIWSWRCKKEVSNNAREARKLNEKGSHKVPTPIMILHE